ncbi:MAG TPA: hypothetical protein DDW50_04155, partial [Firmicutes bacterium]|nr:hypothetical protein [Bacillota bacterium]
MEPRNKMNNTSSKDLFLKNLRVDYEQPQIYSLEDEFSKSKKNQDIKPYCIFFGFIIVLIAATVFTTHYLEIKSKQVSIDISDFEDIRLKETLHAAKAKEEELHQKSAELDTKAKELVVKNKELDSKTGEIKNLQASYDKDLQQAKENIQEQSDLSQVNQRVVQRLAKKDQKQIEKIIKSYEAQLAKKAAELLRLQDQIKDNENKTGDLKSYQYGLSLYVKDKKAMGCIIDPRQHKNIISYFVRDPKITTETIVNLYRGDDDYIGQLKLVPDETGLRVELSDTVKNIK